MFLLNAIIIAFFLTVKQVDGLICSRYPTHTNMPKSPVDENFIVTINGNPQTYVLGQEYNVTIQSYNSHRFISFKLALENDEGNPSLNEDLGHFELIDPIETRYSPNCINMVESTNTNPKSRIDVIWVAPQEPGNGCVLIRTTLLQHRDVWFMDDGGLTRRICEESVDEVESEPLGTEKNSCCACDEARYELIFEGMWSRNIHPKDFPAKGWITRFSDIIGATHTDDYRFWEYGQLATDGMKEFAEHGSARTLEREFSYNFKDNKIRTIIKARGPAFPNLNGQSLASVRVDPKHHLISLASKVDPSPDWIVGISGLELCMTNCTWLDGKTISLYPWDIGTDAGPSYTSPDQPQVPADVIRRMRSDFPNDPRSPFFDVTGAPMKPLAMLKIRRQRLYERLCEDEESNNVDIPRECFTHPWTKWSDCSMKCGDGRQFRTRVYKQPEVAKIFNCEIDTRQDRACIGEDCGANEIGLDRGQTEDRHRKADFIEEENEIDEMDETVSRADCQLTDWSEWSPCSRTCGEGRMIRRRQYVNPMLRKQCKNINFAHLVDYQKCMGRECLEGGGAEELVEEKTGGKNENAEEHEPENTNEGAARTENEEGGEQEGNDRREQDDLENEAPVGFGNWQKNRGANRGYKRPTNSHERDHESNFEDNEKEDENFRYENEGSDEEEAYDENENGYGNRFSNVGRRKTFFTNANQDGDENVFGNRSPNRYGSNNRYFGAGSRNNEKEGEVLNMRGRNRLPHSRMDDDEKEKPDITPNYCFDIPTKYTCPNAKAIRNYWFYNYCEDQCMLFTADSCDKNENKFTSLEMCEETCRQSGYEDLLQAKQRKGCFRKRKGRKYSKS